MPSLQSSNMEDVDSISLQAQQILQTLDGFTFGSGKKLAFAANDTDAFTETKTPKALFRKAKDYSAPKTSATTVSESPSHPRSMVSTTTDGLNNHYLQLEKERQEVRQWAQQMRSAVYEWVHQQKVLMKCKQQKETTKEESLLHQQYKRTISSLQETVHALESELDTVKSQNASKICELEEFIQQQQKRIQELEREKTHDQEKQHDSSTLPAKQLPCVNTIFSNVENRTHPHPRNTKVINQPSPTTSRTTELTETGSQITRYRNGSTKEHRSDGTTIIRFANGDIRTFAGDPKDKCVESYYFAKANILQMKFVDGSVQELEVSGSYPASSM